MSSDDSKGDIRHSAIGCSLDSGLLNSGKEHKGKFGTDSYISHFTPTKEYGNANSPCLLSPYSADSSDNTVKKKKVDAGHKSSKNVESFHDLDLNDTEHTNSADAHNIKKKFRSVSDSCPDNNKMFSIAEEDLDNKGNTGSILAEKSSTVKKLSDNVECFGINELDDYSDIAKKVADKIIAESLPEQEDSDNPMSDLLNRYHINSWVSSENRALEMLNKDPSNPIVVLSSEQDDDNSGQPLMLNMRQPSYSSLHGTLVPKGSTRRSSTSENVVYEDDDITETDGERSMPLGIRHASFTNLHGPLIPKGSTKPVTLTGDMGIREESEEVPKRNVADILAHSDDSSSSGSDFKLKHRTPTFNSLYKSYVPRGSNKDLTQLKDFPDEPLSVKASLESYDALDNLIMNGSSDVGTTSNEVNIYRDEYFNESLNIACESIDYTLTSLGGSIDIYTANPFNLYKQLKRCIFSVKGVDHKNVIHCCINLLFRASSERNREAMDDLANLDFPVQTVDFIKLDGEPLNLSKYRELKSKLLRELQKDPKEEAFTRALDSIRQRKYGEATQSTRNGLSGSNKELSNSPYLSQKARWKEMGYDPVTALKAARQDSPLDCDVHGSGLSPRSRSENDKASFRSKSHENCASESLANDNYGNEVSFTSLLNSEGEKFLEANNSVKVKKLEAAKVVSPTAPRKAATSVLPAYCSQGTNPKKSYTKHNKVDLGRLNHELHLDLIDVSKNGGYDSEQGSERIPQRLYEMIDHPKPSIVYLALCGVSVVGYQAKTINNTIQELKKYLDKCVKNGYLEESIYINKIIENIKHEREELRQMEYIGNYDEILLRLEEAERDFEKRRKLWDSQMKIFEQEYVESLSALERRHAKEVEELNSEWISEKMKDKFNRPSPKLVELRNMAQRLISAHRFDEAAVLAMEISKKEHEESLEAAEKMRHSYLNAVDKLRQKLESDKVNLSHLHETKKAALENERQKNLLPLKNRVFHLQAQASDACESQKRAERAILLKSRQVKTRQTPIKKTAPSAFEHRKLQLPPLKALKPASLNAN